MAVATRLSQVAADSRLTQALISDCNLLIHPESQHAVL